MAAENGPEGKESGGSGPSILKNPLTYLFKRDGSQGSKENNQTGRKQEKGRRKVLEKSVSMMEEFGRVEKISRISRHNKKELLKELKSSSLTRTRTNPGHLDTSYFSCDEFRGEDRDTPSPPPFPSPPDNNIKEILSSGQYYSFHKVRHRHNLPPEWSTLIGPDLARGASGAEV